MPNRFINHLPLTEAGAGLELTEEEKAVCQVVYQVSEENPRIYQFHSLWDARKQYSDEYVILPLQSVYKGLSEKYAKGTVFANVEGSSGDHSRDGRTWRQVMKAALEGKYIWNTCCAELNTVYRSDNHRIEAGFACTNGGKELPKYPDFENGIWMQGAHVLMRSTASGTVRKGDDVCLLPLCENHNIYAGITGHYGTGYYMKLNRPMKAVILSGYLNERFFSKEDECS